MLADRRPPEQGADGWTPGTPVVVAADQPARVWIDVTNDSNVIEGVLADVEVPEGMTARVFEPEGPLFLFPDRKGPIGVELQVGRTFTAGADGDPARAVLVHLHSSHGRAGGDAGGLCPPVAVPYTVPPAPAGDLQVEPAVRAGRHRARYVVTCHNAGNVPLDLALSATDPERSFAVTFAPSVLSVEPGRTGRTELQVRRRRRLRGGETSHQITVAGTSADLQVDTKAVFRHKPLMPTGVRTALVLATLVVGWAAIILVALHFALNKNPLAVEAPASFYASASPAALHAAEHSALGGINFDLASANGSTPKGAVPKTGIVVGVGGTISGTVDARSTGAGVGDITVQAVQGGQVVASAATAADGSYSVDGLMPGAYLLELSAPGYPSLWYGGRSGAGVPRGRAAPVQVDAQATTAGIDVVVQGLPGTITGTVVTGMAPAPPVTVQLEALQGNTTTPIRTVQAHGGHYTLAGIPTPGLYQLLFTATGYHFADDQEQLAGGAHDVANTVTLSAAAGGIQGQVTAAGRPLGGVAITAKGDGRTYRTTTPTQGAVGQYVLVGLPSPATYLLSFSEAGYGTVTEAERLGPGQQLTLDASLAGGAGTIAGRVTSAGGAPLGDVAVTVTGGGTTVTTQTFSDQQTDAGQYDVTGLTTPGTYLLTFSAPGYVSQTIQVALTAGQAVSGKDVTLQTSAATIVGDVVDASTGLPLGGVKVELTNGVTTQATTSATGPPGKFAFTGLAAGSYTLTFTLAGYAPATYVVTVSSGGTATVTAQLQPVAG